MYRITTLNNIDIGYNKSIWFNKHHKNNQIESVLASWFNFKLLTNIIKSVRLSPENVYPPLVVILYQLGRCCLPLDLSWSLLNWCGPCILDLLQIVASSSLHHKYQPAKRKQYWRTQCSHFFMVVAHSQVRNLVELR